MFNLFTLEIFHTNDGGKNCRIVTRINLREVKKIHQGLSILFLSIFFNSFIFI